MGRRSKVTNMRDEVYDQIVNGVHYVIKPHETMEMDRFEAVNVIGHYCGPTKVNLKIDHILDNEEKKATTAGKVFVSPDGKEFSTKELLMEYMKKVK